ncbi:hypothetical protein JMA_05100 [Jeotgalibacillus malaysiensis]|uniref:Uncharacterized protein n=1 Tax=Jeotgalibacillus malaysiensis TaxID=1508404 RepID=A0A0B5AMF2_9BACL|nr:hypothetical protein JMA_05100 [Jeotgalibacillus malaysiensis]
MKGYLQLEAECERGFPVLNGGTLFFMVWSGGWFSGHIGWN